MGKTILKEHRMGIPQINLIGVGILLGGTVRFFFPDSMYQEIKP